MRTLALVLLCGLACAPAVRHEEQPACDPSHPGIEAGVLALGGPDSTDATATGRFALGRHGSCRRVTLALEGTRTGPVSGRFDRAYGVVRFALPVTQVGQADSTFKDSTVAAAYVVHELAGGYRLDVHLARPAFARALAVGSKIVLDLEPGGGAIPTLAPRARNVVVMEPRDGGVTYPIVIKGYARTFEANVQAWLEVRNAVLPATKVHATAADWIETWGEFELTIPNGPSGEVILFVGEESAKDGTPIGVRIPLRAASGATAGGR